MEIRELIQELGKAHTGILSSHILSEVQSVCQTILIIAHGKLVACDSPENLERLFAGTATVELFTDAAPEELCDILSGVAHISGMQTEKTEAGTTAVRLDMDIPANDQLCRDIFFAFSKAQKAILQMTMARISLEDIFIELTQEDTPKDTPEETDGGENA